MSKRSRIHPKYKTKYRVTNWPEYDRSLTRRGDLTLWLSPASIAGWNAKPSGRLGGQQKYLDLAIETALTLRIIYHLPLRQTEGFLTSLFAIMAVPLEAPDHTTLSRRSGTLNIPLVATRSDGPIDLVVDSTGLAIFGQGQWAAAKHGLKGVQGWKKLHIGVDAQGVIVAQVLTDSNVDDATTGIDFIGRIDDDIAAVIGDAAYDTRPFYDAAVSRGAEAVVPPTKNAVVTGRRCPPRDETIRRVHDVGRRQWKTEAGYHRQGKAENTFFRYKTIIADRLRARGRDAQRVEARLACNILNRMSELGMPASAAIET